MSELPLADLRENFEKLGCPIRRLEITLNVADDHATNHPHLHFHLKMNGRASIFRQSKGHMWLAREGYPAILDRAIKASIVNKVTSYDRARGLLKVFAIIPENEFQALQSLVDQAVQPLNGAEFD